MTSFSNELGRLAQGAGTRMPTGTNIIHFIAKKTVTVRRTVTYGRIVATIRSAKVETHRVRLTVDSNRTNYYGDKSIFMAEIETVNILLNSTISTPRIIFSTVDVKDFYVNTPISTFEYMRLPINIIPEEIILECNLLSRVVNRYIYIEIRKGMYGLSQAGKIAFDRLKIILLNTATHQLPFPGT